VKKKKGQVSIVSSTKSKEKHPRVGNVYKRKTYAKVLEEVLGLAVDVQETALVVAGVESRNLGDVLILALTLLLLKLEGDTADGTTLDTLHQVGGVSGNLVAQALGGNDGNLIADALVGLEVESQAGVVTLNDDLGGLLDGLGTNATHVGGIWLVVLLWGIGVGGCQEKPKERSSS
jgi:hypothetical protein